jgi:glycosyltransferase involved in cell wall biosynthesis
MRNADAGPIRVLLAAPCLGSYGGIEAFVFAVADAVRRDRRFELRICFKRVAGFSLQDAFASICARYPVEFCDRASAALLSAIAWADVVHGQNVSPDIAILALALGKPFALTIHDFLPAAPRLRRISWQLAARAATERWFNSHAVWRTWEPSARAGSARVPTVSALTPSFVEPSVRRGFVFVGRLVDSKGADVLLRAYAEAALDPSVWPLTIIGDGPMRSALDDLSQRLALRGLSFRGFVDDETKTDAMAGAKWLVAPSHAHEGLGLIAIEARNHGVPCIVSRHGGLPEAAGRDALVVEPADVVSLAQAMRHAASMPDTEYAQRSDRTRADLAQELVPLSFYIDAYRRLATGRPDAATAAVLR